MPTLFLDEYVSTDPKLSSQRRYSARTPDDVNIVFGISSVGLLRDPIDVGCAPKKGTCQRRKENKT